MDHTFDAIVEQWFLVTLCDDDKEPMGEMLWGIVIDDQKRRFEPGHYVCTSAVIEQVTPSLFRTMNTTYKCEGEGERVTLGIENLSALRQGFNPTEIQIMAELKRKEHQHMTLVFRK